MEAGYRNIKETFKILHTIGRGSFATVKKAQNRETKEYVAVKVFSKKKLDDEDTAALRNEVDIIN